MSRFDAHRGARPNRLAAAVFFCAATGIATAIAIAPAHASDLGCPLDSTLVTFGIAGGAQYVDLPSFDDPQDALGTCMRVAFDLSVFVRPWFEPNVEVAFAYLGSSDSLDAALVELGSDATSLGTLVQAQVGFRAHLPRCGRVQPFVQAGAGLARWRLVAPDLSDATETDAIWSAGAGASFWLHPRVLIRANGGYVGQETDDATSAHAVVQIGFAYAFSRDIAGP